ncbi:MAG: hypothetical protein WBB69_05140 [Anaerolineales bacterium]
MINSIVAISRAHQRERMRQAKVENQVSSFEQGKKKKLNLWKFITRLYKPRKHLAWGTEFECV